ncbi:LmeA family phospholipid-binding protein [Williamsia sp. MIQD14]|uniref:LmeA family phospholipid-binding protein n=1 Tax=Williamsia sp. MIQD14 TaxID=3425703 RepID=UPI003D9FCC08
MNEPERPDNNPQQPGPTPPTEQFPVGGQAYSQTRPFDAEPQTHQVPASDPGPTPTRPKRRTGVIVTISALVVVLVLVIAGVGSELYLRNATKDCLEKSFSDVTGSSASVSLSKKPMLLQYATKKVPYVQIDADGDNGTAIELHGRADDITARSDGSTLGSLSANGSVPFSRIVELSKQSAATAADQNSGGTTQNDQSGLGGLFGGFTLNSVTGNQSTGTMSLDATVTVAIFPIPVSVELKPTVTGGKIEFQVVKASALVFGVPSGFAQTLVDGVSKSLFPPLFDQLDFQQLSVTSTGVDFRVSGSDVPLNQDTLGSTPAQQQGSTSDACTIL